MAEMLQVLIFGLRVMTEESSQLDLEINWSKTKIQVLESVQGSSVLILDYQVYLVDTFVYLGSSTDQDGGRDSDMHGRIELASSCMRPWTVASSEHLSLYQPNIACTTFPSSQLCFMVLTYGQ